MPSKRDSDAEYVEGAYQGAVGVLFKQLLKKLPSLGYSKAESHFWSFN
jgi:hypothetical protein